MKEIFRYTLLADGTSDEVLMPVIDWLIRQHLPDVRSVASFARDFGKVGNDLRSRIRAALKNFPCDLLFVHRDAESMTREDRIGEIVNAMDELGTPHVPIVPIRMTEAWLLSDEEAIRFASGNASGRHALNIPRRDRWEALPDPKNTLLDILKSASGKNGRALDKFNPLKARHLITPRSASFDALRGVPSFDRFENDLIEQLAKFSNVVD
ncbi:hypothetical protein [Massilia sp. Root335]|uniref:hypothetical protein n=1 Tax=Massilia sp. Root335 TaxID=1736517 RepID=UPI000B05B590|nr:hypothetical protein [Massilia sp. Root335]